MHCAELSKIKSIKDDGPDERNVHNIFFLYHTFLLTLSIKYIYNKIHVHIYLILKVSIKMYE